MTPRRASQDILARYRAEASPDPAVRERVLGELARRIASGERAMHARPARPMLREVPTLRPSTWLKFHITALALGALLAATVWLWRAREARVVGPHAIAPSVAPPLPTVAVWPAANAAARGPVAPVELAPQPAATRPALQRAPRRRAASAALAPPPSESKRGVPDAGAAPLETSATPTSKVQAASVAAHGDLEKELRLMRSAYDALRDGRLDDATARLAEHEAWFPRGDLAESREVAQIMVLCKRGQTQAARARVAQFLQRSPHSPYAARVRSLCLAP